MGDEGLLAMVCDSTNVFVEGEAGSELEAQEGLIELIGSLKKGKIAVGCFASNVARMVSVIKAADRPDVASPWPAARCTASPPPPATWACSTTASAS